MDRERYLCWTVLIGLLESLVLMLVMPAHSAGGQDRFVGTGVSRCNETPYRRPPFYGSLSLSLSLLTFAIPLYLSTYPPTCLSTLSLHDRESDVVASNDYLPTLAINLCVCESGGVVR